MGLAEFTSRIEAWASELLDAYVEQVAAQAPPNRNKEFNDPIWGTLVLRPFEVLILDSPLLQRLRRIRQLGVVHLVYPAATHTRLEHSLGSVHQMDRLVSVINTEEEVIKPAQENLLRLCALCHDIGHGVMSHVSENALEMLDLSESIQLDFSDLVGGEPKKLSEIVAYLTIGTPSFQKLLDTVMAKIPSHLLPPDPSKKMQEAVIGQAIPGRIPLLNELVSGPFDADKLDYLPRDAHMCGVPVVTDIPRLIQKVRAVEVEKARLPREIIEYIQEDAPSYWVIGIDLSGGRTLDELILGRILLFDKLYRHHKVRAAETMVAAMMQQLIPFIDEDPLTLSYRFEDEFLLDVSRESIQRLAINLSSDEAGKAIEIATDLSDRLRTRRLFARAYAFAQNMPLDPFKLDRTHRSGLSRLIQDCRSAPRRLELEADVAAETRTVLQSLGATETLDAFPDGNLVAYVRISPPQPPAQAGSSAFAYLLAGRSVLKFREEAAEMPGWSNAYLLTRDIGYIFAPPELTPYVFLAAEKVFREKYAVRVPALMLDYARQDADRIDQLRQQLADASFYDSSPFDLRPKPPRLRRPDVSTRLSEVRERLAGYSGPVTTPATYGGAADVVRTSGAGGLLTDQRMVAWLGQFQTDDLVDAAMRALERVKLVSRSEIVAALSAFLDENGDFSGSSLCVLGSPKDSSSIATYYAGDLASEYGLTIRDTLEAALGQDERIIFIDDFVGTGSQAISIACSWLGEDPGFDLGETRGRPLGDVHKQALKDREIGFVFAAGAPNGATNLLNRCGELGLNAVVKVKDEGLPTVFDNGIFTSTDQANNFIERCRLIGAQLLTDPDEGHDAAWAADRALGYGNNGFLVISEHNTPAQSLTCLWSSGTYEGAEWMPLFPRRKKH